MRRSPAAVHLTLLALAASCGLFTGCATVPSAPVADWPTARAARQSLSHWELTGRAAVATATQGWSAAVTWNQSQQVSELRLQGALGVGGVHVRSDGQSVQIDTSKGESFSDDDAAPALERTIGVALPLASLRYWLLGVPAPGSEAQEEVDAEGRLTTLKQEGWSASYDRYEYREGAWLPGRVRLENGPVRVKVIVDRWSF